MRALKKIKIQVKEETLEKYRRQLQAQDLPVLDADTGIAEVDDARRS